MTTVSHDPEQEHPLRHLYPDLNEQEVKEAERRLEGYLALALRIWTRIHSDPVALANFVALTGEESDPTMNSERSNNNTLQS